jgi:cardiolipin synthase
MPGTLPGLSAWRLLTIGILGLLVSACSTQSAKTGTGIDSTASLSQRAEDDTGTPAEFIAESAWLAGDRFYIRYRTGSEVAYTTGAALPAGNNTGRLAAERTAGVPTEVALQAVQESSWQLPPAAGRQALHILPATHWETVFHLLRKTLTPEQSHTGAVIDILQLEEWFSWYDDTGTLQWVPIEDKPADVRVKYSYSFAQVLVALRTILSDYLAADGVTSRQVLLNTGAAGPDATPFVYADLDAGRVLFLTSRPVASRPPDAKSEVAHVRATTHVVIGQVRSLVERPMTSIGRLFARTSQEVVDTLHRTVLLPQRAEHVPPVSKAPGMDLQAWESRLDEITGTRASTGRMKYLVDGVEFFPRMIDVIQSARESIDIRMYIFDDDDYAIKMADILKARSREVRIRVLLDGLGTIGSAMQESESLPAGHRAPASIFDYLKKDSRIKVKSVSNFWLTGDHSKSVVVDKHIGFIGGMNFGREYRYDWHDMMIELEGPVVDILREDFFRAWVHERFLGDLQLMLRRYKPAGRETQAGDYPVRVLFTRPMDSQIYRAQLAAIRNAKSYIYIENAYFTDDVVLDALIRARARGVDVRMILPLRSDFGVISRNNVLVANTLLDNGIRVYIYPGMSHLKAAVYDGWICLGSANFDKLSLRINKEINIATSHPQPVDDLLERVFIPDMEASVELTEPFPENWLDFLVEMMADHL